MAKTKKATRPAPARRAVQSVPRFDAHARAREERKQLLAGRKLQREIVSLVDSLERAMRRADYKLLTFATVIAQRQAAAKRLDAEVEAAERNAREESARASTRFNDEPRAAEA